MYNPIIFNNEEFKDIVIPNVKPIYSVSNYGTIINKITGEQISMQITSDGYLRVGLSCLNGNTKHFLVHRLVLMAFCPIPNPESFEGNHLKGIKIDNRVEELEWTTTLENNHHSFDTGLNNNIRENHAKAKLTNDQVHLICQCLEKGMTIKEIEPLIIDTGCIDLGRNIRAIRERKAWVTISKDYSFSSRNNRDMFCDDEVRIICKMIEADAGYKNILISLGIDISTLSSKELANYCDIISNIRVGKYYSDISKDFDFSKSKLFRHDQTLDNDKITKVCKCLESGMSSTEILNKLNISKESVGYEKYDKSRRIINKIRARKAFISISKDYDF